MRTRIMSGFILVSVIFSFAALMPFMSDMNPTLYFYVTLGLIIFSGVSSALLGGIIGIVSSFPSLFMTAITIGQGIFEIMSCK